MNVKETIEAARDSLTVRRVYGEAFERNGVAVIPAAAVQGGAAWDLNRVILGCQLLGLAAMLLTHRRLSRRG